MIDKAANNDLAKAVERVFNAEPNDIACDAAAVIMARIVDGDNLTLKAAESFPELSRHLKVCSDCAAEYQMILDLGRLHTSAHLTDSSISVPPRPDRTGLLDQVQSAVDTLINFSGFGRLVSGPVRGIGLDITPAEIELDGGLLLELDVGLHSNNPNLRDIFVSVQQQDGETDVELEGVSVWVAPVGEDDKVATAMLDRYGEAILPAVEPDVFYFLQVELVSNITRVQHIKLP